MVESIDILRFVGFLIPSILMGTGIAIDVTIATIAKFQDEHLSLTSWTIPVTITHILFPALGYYTFWYVSSSLSGVSMLLGVVGFSLVALFLYETVCEWTGRTPVFGISSSMAKLFGFSARDTRRIIAILAVSWDALWSGPAKAALAEAGGWGAQEVLWSFIIAGMTVAIAAEASLLAAKHLRKIKFHDAENLAKHITRGKYIELTVIGSFGVLSLLQGVFGNGSFLLAIAGAATIAFVVLLLVGKEMRSTARAEALEIVENRN